MCINSQYAAAGRAFVRQTLNRIRPAIANPLIASVAVFLATASAGALISWHENAEDVRERRALASNIGIQHVRALQDQLQQADGALNHLAAVLLNSPRSADAARQVGTIHPEISDFLTVRPDGRERAGSIVSLRHSGSASPPLSSILRLVENTRPEATGGKTSLHIETSTQGSVAIVVMQPAGPGGSSPGSGNGPPAANVAILSAEGLADRAGLRHLAAMGYDFELLILGDGRIGQTRLAAQGEPISPVTREFTVFSRDFELRIAPSAGWTSWASMLRHIAIIMAISFLAAVLAYMAARATRARASLQSSEQRFRDLTEMSTDWWWEQDDQLRFTAVSPALSYAGITAGDHIGKTRWELPNTALPRGGSWDAHIQTLQARKPFHNLLIERRVGNSTRQLRVSGKPLFDTDGRFLGYRGTTADITDEFVAQQALKASEANFRGIFNVVPDPLIVRDSRDVIRQVNQAACRFFGAHSADELIGRDWFTLYAADEREIAKQRSKLLIEPQTPLAVVRRRFMRLDGEIIVGEITGLVIIKREGRMVLTVIHDCSERDAAARQYEMLQQELTRSVIATREQERRALSIELHDRIGQTLTAVRFHIDFLKEQIPAALRESMESGLASIYDLLQNMSHHVRDLMADLHPPALDDYGLRTALAFHLDKISQRTGVAAELHGLEFNPRLPQDKELMLFRIAQEALNNIIKHAECTKIMIRLDSDDDHLRMTVADNGTGFEPSLVNSSKFGLRIMRERAESIGAQLDIEEQRGSGTRIIVTLPRSAAAGN